jgi:hypothetical protein
LTSVPPWLCNKITGGINIAAGQNKTEGQKMSKATLNMLAVGDIILEGSLGEKAFSFVAPLLKSGDVVIGQGECPFTARGEPFVEVQEDANYSPGCPPVYMRALADAGFNIITPCSNHMYNLGTPGLEDTINGLRNLGIAYCGAGMNIDEARRPAVIERDGTRVGLLAYNCVGPKNSWALPDRPGCAFVNIITHYEPVAMGPGSNPAIYTFPDPHSLNEMIEDVHKLRPDCDVLVVSFHKGLLSSAPYKLAMYEQPISYAAIDAGADLVLGHHSHMLKGIEIYKGKAIFHNLGHFVPDVATPSGTLVRLADYIRGVSGIEVQSSAIPFPDSLINDPIRRRTIIAKCTIDSGHISRVGYIPCLITDRQPHILKHDEQGQEIFDHLDKITREAGLNTRYEWEGDEVITLVD